MKALLILLATGIATTAWAQTRPTTPFMDCAAAHGIVRVAGAVVLNTGPHTYDRYVSGAGFCGPGEFTEPAWVPSADTQQCFIGYRCRGRFQRQSFR